MAKISEYKVMNVSFENGMQYNIHIPSDPKNTTVMINDMLVSIVDLKQIVDVFTDRYPFAFSDETADVIKEEED